MICGDGDAVRFGGAYRYRDSPGGQLREGDPGDFLARLKIHDRKPVVGPELDEERFADSPLQTMSHKTPAVARSSNGDYRIAPVGEFWEGPGQCPKCHAPVGKRHGKPCVG